MGLTPKQSYIQGGHINIQSITNKTGAIKEFILEKNLDFLALTETWLDGEVCDKSKIKEMTPSSHKFYQRARKSRGGGVGILLSKCFKNVVINETPTVSTFEVLDLTGYTLNRKLRIITVYRTPNSNIATFLDEFENFLNTFNDEML